MDVKIDIQRVRAIEWTISFGVVAFLLFKFGLIKLVKQAVLAEGDFMVYFLGVGIILTSLLIGYFIGMFIFSTFKLLTNALQDIFIRMRENWKIVKFYAYGTIILSLITPFILLLINKTLQEVYYIVAIIGIIFTILYNILNYHKKK